jgi:hypothetical protein
LGGKLVPKREHEPEEQLVSSYEAFRIRCEFGSGQVFYDNLALSQSRIYCD